MMSWRKIGSDSRYRNVCLPCKVVCTDWHAEVDELLGRKDTKGHGHHWQSGDSSKVDEYDVYYSIFG